MFDNISSNNQQDTVYHINIADMNCSACVANIESAIHSVVGVTQVQINLLDKKASISGGDPQNVVSSIIDKGYHAVLIQEAIISDQLTLIFQGNISNLANDTSLKALLTQEAFEIDYHWPNVLLKIDTHPAQLLITLQNAGYTVCYKEQFDDPHTVQRAETHQEIRHSWQRALLAGMVGITLMLGNMSGLLPELNQSNGQLFWGFTALVCLFTIWFSGRHYYKSAFKQARHFSSNMDTLITLGTSAAWLSSILIIINPNFMPHGGNHLYLDASVFILAFLQLGHVLEMRAKQVTREAIGTLIELAPTSATYIFTDVQGKQTDIRLPISLLRKNDQIRIKPGETIAVDADVTSGVSYIDESMLTGEAKRVKKQVGDEIIGGTSNYNGTMIAKISRLGENTTLSTIVKMVKQAQLSKPPIANLVDKVSKVFVPIVILIAIFTFISWLFLASQPLSFALTTSIAVLVIACPCALGLATPIAIMMGMGRAAQLGILIKNSDALQSASHLTHIVMDKTGTLTKGKLSITHIYNMTDQDDEHLLQLASSLEIGSEHPLAQAILDVAQDKNIQPLDCHNFHAMSGYGIAAQIHQKSYIIGNQRLMEQGEIVLDKKWQIIARQAAYAGGTPIWLANNEQLLGLFILNDPIREESAIAIKRLHDLNIKVVMCTGDHHETALVVGQSLGVDEIHSELLPEHKLKVITELQQQGHHVGMVGDGVNDAPALAKANTGFAIGSGTDVAIEHADIILAGDSLNNVALAVQISHVTLTNIKQNLGGAFIYNMIGIPLAAGLFYPITGWLLTPAFASLAMAMSSVTVVMNANRIRFFKPE
ncbi:MAG: copper-translocating P-type ATPase [Gammaproteobacteria bacterium]|nr:copper-translocating P-type ATPase [Gammaproteobacteria bacterium]